MALINKKSNSDINNIIYALLYSTLISIALVSINAYKSHSLWYYFLIYNLALAYLPALLAWWLIIRLKNAPWLSTGNIILTILWLGFLPNSFYMITDLIHADTSIGIDLLYNIVMIMLCIFNAVVAGYISLYLIHTQLLKRFYYRYVHIFIGMVLLLCSFAIYLGRFLRWNSWDVIVNPLGLLFDVSDSIESPATHPEVLSTTLTFFLLLSAVYIIIWQISKLLKKQK